MFYVVSACASTQSKFPMAAFAVRRLLPTSASLMRRGLSFLCNQPHSNFINNLEYTENLHKATRYWPWNPLEAFTKMTSILQPWRCNRGISPSST